MCSLSLNIKGQVPSITNSPRVTPPPERRTLPCRRAGLIPDRAARGDLAIHVPRPRRADRLVRSRPGAEVADRQPRPLARATGRPPAACQVRGPRRGDAAAVAVRLVAARRQTWSRPIRPLDAGGPVAQVGSIDACTGLSPPCPPVTFSRGPRGRRESPPRRSGGWALPAPTGRVHASASGAMCRRVKRARRPRTHGVGAAT